MNVMGMACYTEASFNVLRVLPEAKIDISYPQFVDRFTRAVAEFDRQGIRAAKVQIDDIGQMVEWCHKHGYQIDNAGRVRFVTALGIAREHGEDVMTKPFEDRTRVLQ